MRLMVAVLVVGVLAYLTVYFAAGWHEPVMTTQAYETSVSVGTSANGLLIREEQVIRRGGGEGYVDLAPAEGERVAAGQAVATVYRDAALLEDRQTIRQLTAEIEQLKYAQSSGADGADTAKLDGAVLQSIVSLRSIAATGDLSGLEDSALNLRTMVFKRDYTYGEGGAASGVAALIQQKEEQRAALQSTLSRAATTVYAPASGVFSGEADGYEDLLDPAAALDLTPSALDELIRRNPDPPDGAVGKLITGSTWYLAAALDEDQARGLTVGKTYPVTFSHDWFGTVDMTLEHVSDKQAGLAVYLFSARTRLADTALLRVQTVDISTSLLTGIRVPKQSLRVSEETVTDKETGTETTVPVTGVFTVVGTQAELQEVNVLYTAEDFYLVEPVDPAAARRLRAGDQVILNSAGIFDGKVVV